MKKLSDFLAHLPGVQPIKARRLILDGDLLSTNDRDDIHERDSSLLDTVVEVGPDAARAILAAYRDGRLPMQRGTRPTIAPHAEEYLKNADELRKEAAERKRRRQALDDPSLIRESDFTDHRLMDNVFYRNAGAGSRSLMLAGITVNKTVIPYKSNSGKSTGWLVRFDWIGTDGKRRYSQTEPPEALNRRNDPERNWGLPD